MANLTIAEAAVRLGITKEALRTRVRRRQIESFKDVDGQWRVVVPDDTAGGASDVGRDTGADTPPGRGFDADAVIALLRDQLAEKDRQISELHVLLQTSQQNEQRLLSATVPEPAGSTERRDEGKPSGVGEPDAVYRTARSHASGSPTGEKTPQRGAGEAWAGLRDRLSRWRTRRM